MRVSDLQLKDVVNTLDGKNIGRIIDIDISEDGVINYFVIESRKLMKRINIYGGDITVKMADIERIGKDVILVKYQ